MNITTISSVQKLLSRTDVFRISIRFHYKTRRFRGIYITDGMRAHKDDTLVIMYKMDYHPGLNVSYCKTNMDRILRAKCDGTVFITTEDVKPNYDLPEMKDLYEWRKDVPIKKLTFNVVPDEQKGRFRLRETI